MGLLWVQAKTGMEGPEQARMVREMVREYVKGLCWVMRYYYQGGFLNSALVMGAALSFIDAIPLLFACLYSCKSTQAHWLVLNESQLL